MNKKNIILLSVSFIIALFVWAYVMDSRNPYVASYEIRNVPVTLINQDIGPMAHGMTVLEGENQYLSLQISGRRSDILGLDRNKITANLDVSSLTRAGVYNVQVTVEIGNSGITVNSRSPRTIEVYVDEIIEKTVPVKVETSGGVGAGSVLGNVSVYPGSVIVTGPQKEVDIVEYARVNVTIPAGSGASFNTVQQVEYFNSKDEPVSFEYSTSNTENVNISVGILKSQSLPLEAHFTGQLPENLVLRGFEISPETILIGGSADFFANNAKIELEAIDLSEIIGSGAVRAGIKWPSGATNVGGVKEISVILEVEEKIEMDYAIPTIDVEGTDNPQSIIFEESIFMVTLRGAETWLDSLSPDDIIASVDLSNHDMTPGDYELPLKVEVVSEEKIEVVGVYFVKVRII